MGSKRGRILVLFVIGCMFSLGFLFGYFLQGSTLLTTEQEIESVRSELDTLQLEQLLLAQSPGRSCPVIARNAQESSEKLYDIVNDLGSTTPSDPRFSSIKTTADILSVKSWLFSSIIEDQCKENITTILFVYKSDCEKCVEQNTILQEIKNQTILVYSIDYNSDQRIINVVKESYQINSTPSMIIRGNVYGFLDRDEIEKLI